MKKIYSFKMIILIFVVALIITYIPSVKAENVSGFILTAEEQAYLETIRNTPVIIAYSYDLVAAEFNGQSYSMIDPIIDVMENKFGLTVELKKINWHNAFIDVENGDIDFYGPIAISELRRQEYVTVDPFYRSYSKIMTRVAEPMGSMVGLYNRSIGLLEGSVMSRTMQAYLGPEGKTIYFPTMEKMIEGLQNGLIDAFATVDNAEFEILYKDDISFEFSVENFYVDQGFISSKEKMRPLAELINRYISENTDVTDKIINLRNEALIQFTKIRFAGEIKYLQENYNEITMFAEPILYPLCYEENGVIKGMQVEIHDVFKELTGIPVRFGSDTDFPDGLKSALNLLETGECLAAVAVYYNIDMWNNPSIIYSPLLWADTIRTYSYYDDNSDLSGKRLGTTPLAIDYIGWTSITGNTPVTDGSRKKLLEYLKNGDLDAVFIGEMTFNYEYTINKDYSLREVSGLTAEAAMHMLYGVRNKEFNTLFNNSMNLYHILKPRALGEWKTQSDKYKSDYIRIRYTQQIWTTVAIVVFSAMILIIIILMMKNLRQNKKTISLMKILNQKDVLTGIYNRRYLDNTLDKTIRLLSRSSNPISVFMIDIDYFKRFNDTYGHGKGDECLKMVANALASGVRREDDFVTRYGGEEFTVVLPNTNEDGARIVADKIFEAIKELNIPHSGNEVSDRISISMGITTSIADYTQTGMDYLNKADEALYLSKQNGRNRYTFLKYEKIEN